MRITVVGSGYVGLVAAVCFAELGYSVHCVDNDEAKVSSLCQGTVPIHEEHLPELLNRHRNGAIQFTTDLGAATEWAGAIFIAVGTPQSDTGEADLSYVEAVTTEIARHIKDYKVVVEKSTVPVYTNSWVRRSLERSGMPQHLFDVVSNPEFLREGSAVIDFLHPDRIVVGANTDQAVEVLRRIYLPLTEGTYYTTPNALTGMCSKENPAKILFTTINSSEMIKHASNAFLALKISFIDALANLCEEADADVLQVAKGMGMDARIGERFLSPDVGYGGSCFPKDVAAFRSVATQVGVDFNLLAEVENINKRQKVRFISKVRSALWNLRRKRIAVLGLAFKGGTDDIRESPAIEVIQMLIAEGCVIRAYDPAACERAESELPAGLQLEYVDSIEAAAQDAGALLILTDWKEFAELDPAKLKQVLKHPTIIDGRNLYDLKESNGICRLHLH